MKVSFIEFIRSGFRQRDEKFRQRLSIFLICLIISIVIWITVKLANVYTAVIPVTLHFTQMPSHKVLTAVSDSILQLEIKEKGSVLFNLMYLQPKENVTVSLRFTPLYQDNGTFRATIVSSGLINDIERELGLQGKIASVSPDTIFLVIEPEKSTKLPVSARFEIGYEKHYLGYGKFGLSPDSVTVKGPERIIDQLDSASLGLIRLSNLSDNVTLNRSFPQDSSNYLLSFSPNEVLITIPVEKFTEAEIETQVRTINHDDLRIKTFPDKVKIVYTVALKDYASVESSMITAVADFSTVDLSRESMVKVSLDNYPSFIRIHKIEPERVEFIILK